MRSSALRTIPRSMFLLVLALALTGVVAGTADEQAKPDKQDKQEQARSNDEKKPESKPVNPFLVASHGEVRQAPGDKVYDNEDLKRLFGNLPLEEDQPATPPAGAGQAKPARPGAEQPSAEQPKDPLTQMFDEQKQQAEVREQIAEADKKVVEAQKRVTDLETRLRELHNPYLPRPEPPKEGADEWSKMDGRERVARSEQELSEAREALEKARQEANRLRSSPH